MMLKYRNLCKTTKILGKKQAYHPALKVSYKVFSTDKKTLSQNTEVKVQQTPCSEILITPVRNFCQSHEPE